MTSFKNSKGKGALLQINIEEMIEKWCKIIILIKWEKLKKFNGIIHDIVPLNITLRRWLGLQG